MKTLRTFCFALSLVWGCVGSAFSADKVCDVDHYIQQTAKRCHEVQETIDDVSRFMSDYKKRMRVDVERWGADVLSEFYSALCTVRDLLENENKTLYLYKHVDSNYRETVSKYLVQEFTTRFESSLQTSMQRARASLDAYRKGDVDVNVINLSGRMVDQIGLSGKVLMDIKRFYVLESKKAKIKN